MHRLPIDDALPELRIALRDAGAAVLQAPPGAGKTTRVPLALLDEPWLRGERIVMLEPRRIAARAAARFMAGLLGERVGERVGYRMRLDTRVSPRTRIEVVTEGVLARLIQDDPTLDGVGLVIFDEFHERSLHADLGLALALRTRVLVRDDLRLLVMSATLDGDTVARLLGDAPLVTSAGRSFPVEVRYLGAAAGRPLEPRVAAAVREAIAEEPGDVLVFLPGTGEIRRTAALLADGPMRPDVCVVPLYGDLLPEEQDLAIAPSPPGRRKVVLATSIAETSLTIEGVRVVVDGGLARVPRFSPRSGMSRLETVRVSRAAAEQRRGRAGRVAPGVCYRLWAEAEQPTLPPFATPEIMEADLAPLALELAAAGVPDPAELAWLDPPPAGAFAQARELLRELEALDSTGAIMPHGRQMAALGLHPRLAHMLLTARQLGLGPLACDLAAVLGDRDLLRGEHGPPDADIRLRLEALHDAASLRGHQIRMESVRRARAESRHWRDRIGARGAGDPAESGLVLAFAYPDRIAQQRPGGGGRYLLRNGLGGALGAGQMLSGSAFLVAAELDGRPPDSRITLAAPIEPAELEAHFGDQIERETAIRWDADARAVRARILTRLGAIVLSETPLRDPDPAAMAAALLDGIAAGGIAALPWSESARRLRERLLFLHRLDPTWPDVSDDALAGTLAEWLGPHLHGLRGLDEVARLDLGALLLQHLPWERRRLLDELAPTHLTVPSGSRIKIDYADPATPVLAVRLQELFGLEDTPRIARGAVPLTVHLLSPAYRPVQITRDLAGFWRTTYFDVRKDLKGRYPKHHWPDDPRSAQARTKRRP